MTRTRRHWNQQLRFGAIVGLVMLVGLVVASGTFAGGTDQPPGDGKGDGNKGQWTIEKLVKIVGASDSTYSHSAQLDLSSGGSGSVAWKVIATCDAKDQQSGGKGDEGKGDEGKGEDHSCGTAVVTDLPAIDGQEIDTTLNTKWNTVYYENLSCTNEGPYTYTKTNTATIAWGEKGENEASDSATVTVKCAEKPTTPPDVPPTVVPPTVVPQQPVTPPTPKVDVQVTKTGVASGLYITWTVIVKNVGTGQADAVKVSDTLPAGLPITSGPNLSQGGWNSASKVWDVGQILAGKDATMTVVMFAAEGGTFTNAVIVTASNETETKDNNTAVATVAVSAAPFTPPTVNPKPKPKPVVKPNVCAIVAIGKKSVSVGKASNIKVVTSRGGNPLVGAVVQFKGAGVYKFGTTGKGGVAVVSINASKPGIVTVSVAGKKTCSAQRLGVIGSFEPAVTG